MRRFLLPSAVVAIAVSIGLSAGATAAGPGGWDHVGTGAAPGSRALNGAVRALVPDSGLLYAGGSFTDAGGNANADRIATWNGTSWGALGASDTFNGDVNAIAVSGGRVFAGGNFTNAGGDANADFLAVWDGQRWASFCGSGGPAFGGNVNALQIIGSTLYVGGSYQNGAGIPAADYLLACDLNTGAASALVANDGDSTGAIYSLAVDGSGALIAGGTFINMARIPAADFIASYSGGVWHALGAGTGPSGGAVTGIVRGVGASGPNVYVGTDATDVGGIPQADHVARWDGGAWNAMGADSGGSNGFFTTTTSINTITTIGSNVYVGGSFTDANADPTADHMVFFDGNAWHPIGSNGAGDGPVNAAVSALAVFDQKLFAGGNFTGAGGDPLAFDLASFSLAVAPPAGLPAPTRGETVNVVPVKGTVRVKLPNGSPGVLKHRGPRAHASVGGFVPLAAVGEQIPVGSTLDTKQGTVRLVAATDTSGGTQTGDFSRGLFSLGQGHKSALTTMSMTGGGLNACSKLPRGGSAKSVARAARKRKRSLFSSVHGRFATRGRNSAATVRGTKFTMTDTCAGTLTQVKQGVVTVRDFRLRKTRKVRAGHTYFARSGRLKKH